MLTYALVLLYCTSKLECWKEVPFPNESFVTAEQCRHALERRARILLQPHFEHDDINLGLICESSPATVEAAPPVTAQSGSSTPQAEAVTPGR